MFSARTLAQRPGIRVDVSVFFSPVERRSSWLQSFGKNAAAPLALLGQQLAAIFFFTPNQDEGRASADLSP
jgi:hypothetical protein